MLTSYVEAIKTFEGYVPEAKWDYAQFSNGYGTRARYAGEVIDAGEAERRFQVEVGKARDVVERHAPHIDEGTKAALTSLTYNAGDSWVRSGLGAAVARGDLDQVRSIFQQYNKAGGEVLPGLVSRRAAEALWIGKPELVGGDPIASRASGEVSVPAEATPSAVAAGGGRTITADALSVVSDEAQDLITEALGEARKADGIAAAQALSAQMASRFGPLGASTIDRVSVREFAAGLGNTASLGSEESVGTAPFTTHKLSEIARLIQLDNGHSLRAPDGESDGDRARSRPS
jgi:lysozyme